jgi:hypothetical protein
MTADYLHNHPQFADLFRRLRFSRIGVGASFNAAALARVDDVVRLPEYRANEIADLLLWN